MAKFSIGDLLMGVALVACLLAIFAASPNISLSRTYAFSSMPPSDGQLRESIAADGWANALIVRSGQNVTISTQLAPVDGDGPRPNWEALGYNDATISRSSRAPSWWLLPTIVGFVVVFGGVQQFRKRQAKIKSAG